MTYILIMTVAGVLYQPTPGPFTTRAECQDFAHYLERVESKSYLVPLDQIVWRCSVTDKQP